MLKPLSLKRLFKFAALNKVLSSIGLCEMLTVKNLTILLSDIFPFGRRFKTSLNCFVVAPDIEKAVYEANNSSCFVSL